MPRTKTGNALTAAEKQRRYRERKTNWENQASAVESAARHMLFHLRSFSGESLTIEVPEIGTDNAKSLWILTEAIQKAEAERRHIQILVEQEKKEQRRKTKR